MRHTLVCAAWQMALWQGDVTRLRVDAIVNCNNDQLNERAGVSGHIFSVGGPQLEEERPRSPCHTLCVRVAVIRFNGNISCRLARSSMDAPPATQKQHGAPADAPFCGLGAVVQPNRRAFRLPAKHVIHTVPPKWSGELIFPCALSPHHILKTTDRRPRC